MSAKMSAGVACRNDRRNIPLKIATTYINEGDIFLYRSNSLIGWCISRYGGGEYSHVAVASYRGVPHFSALEVVEQREFKGGRIVSIESQLDEYSGFIDVYRPLLKIEIPKFQANGKINGSAFSVETKLWTPETARAFTDEVRRFAGKPYGWKLIWQMAKHYMPGIRLLYPQNTRDDVENKLNVCSTLAAFGLWKHYRDPCPNLATHMTTPNDLARSSLLNYLFTLVRD